ncbi:MAG: trypsin-like peptidase domain-containing protein [Patescibacteria group bacterium]|nr:trypsin-like peptidase domain-containing protein [Patescibacteria group bacterium]
MTKKEQKQSTPEVYKAVRAVGTFRPKFNPDGGGRIFADELNVIGTAFWLKNEKVLITCAHVVQNLLGPLEIAGLLVVGNSGNYRRATISQIDLAHDLAVLTLVNNTGQPIAGEELDKEAEQGLEIIDTYPSVSTPIAYAGFPRGNQLLNQLHSPTYSEGVIGVEKKDGSLRKEIQISGPVTGGFSGSPVVLKEDSTKVVGIVSNGPTSNNQDGNIFNAVSFEHIKAIACLARS